MAIDNLALSGNIILDIDEASLVPGQPFEFFPGKIYRRSSGEKGPSIHAVQFPNTTNENMAMFDRGRQIADEETNIPSFSHGQTGGQSMTRTASGMSMLLGAASLNIKTVIKNMDDYLLEPLGRALFHWNMQFGKDPLVRGDLDIKATGSESILRKEIKSQRLIQFLQILMNPALAPFANLPKIIKEIARTLELDPDEVSNDLEEALVFAKILGEAGALSGVQGQPQVPQGKPINPGITGNGGGNIGTGKIPVPGEAEFSGNVQGLNTRGQ